MFREFFAKRPTIVKCLRTVCVERTAQDPRTAYSGEVGLLKFSVRESTHFEIKDGHLLIIFKRDFPASLGAKPTFHTYVRHDTVPYYFDTG